MPPAAVPTPGAPKTWAAFPLMVEAVIFVVQAKVQRQCSPRHRLRRGPSSSGVLTLGLLLLMVLLVMLVIAAAVVEASVRMPPWKLLAMFPVTVEFTRLTVACWL